MLLRIRKGYVIEYIGFSFRAGDEESSASYKKYKNVLEKLYPHLYEEVSVEKEEIMEDFKIDSISLAATI